MRKGRREVLLLSMVFLLGAAARGAPLENKKSGGGADDLVGITIELNWTAAAAAGLARAGEAASQGPTTPAVILSVTEGRVPEVMPWPVQEPRSGTSRPRQEADGSWRLGE